MKYKQRTHSRVGGVDKYPEIDKFVPGAERTANELHPDRSAPGYIKNWTDCFCSAMNSILIKEGLRVR